MTEQQQERRPEPAEARPANAADSAGPANPAEAAGPASAAEAARTANPAEAARTANPAEAARPTNPAEAARPTNAAEAAVIPAQATAPAPGPWADYLGAAQRLDAVRRAASAAAGEQQAAVTAARQDLSAVRARLAPQHARLIRDFGVPEGELAPQPTELAAATQAVAGGPAGVLAALHQARATADAADAAIIGPGPGRAWRPWARNLLVYGPFAAAVLVVQIVLYLVAPQGSVPTYALLCGLSMPVLAFGLGWATIGFVYGGEGGKVDRTPIVGAVACLTPVLLTCMGAGLLAFFR